MANIFSDKKKKKAKFIQPPNTLKLKAGNGGISEELLDSAQFVMDTFDEDFSPIAHTLMRNFSAALRNIEANIQAGANFDPEAAISPVMQMKANGTLFKYRLMSEVADICLQFMEALDGYNSDSLEVIRAHENTLKSIVYNNLKGDGGKEGENLVKELHHACQRYFKKYKS